MVAPLDKDSNVAALRGPISSTTRAEVFQTNDSQDGILAGAPTSRFLEFSPDGESTTLDGPISSTRGGEVYDLAACGKSLPWEQSALFRNRMPV